MTFDDNAKGALLLIMGAAIFELGREMRESCPSYETCRDTSDHDHSKIKQYLVDGEMHAGILVAGAALISWWAFKDLFPVMVIIGVYAALVWHQHSVLAAPSTNAY